MCMKQCRLVNKTSLNFLRAIQERKKEIFLEFLMIYFYILTIFI